MSTALLERDPDLESRRRIVTDFDTNFFVEAGAGSGKTTMLVRRMVAMVEAGIGIREISAITFTKAAAGEFFARFQKLLIERSSPDSVRTESGHGGQLPEPTDETRARCAEALEKINLCFLGTIDAFCFQILTEHPSEAGISSDAGIVSDLEASALYRHEYARICDGEYGPELADLAERFRSLHWNPDEVFEAGVALLMNSRNVTFVQPDPVEMPPDCPAYQAQILQAVRCLAAHPELKYTKNRESVSAWESIDSLVQRLEGDWSRKVPEVLAAFGTLKKLRAIPEAQKHWDAELGAVFVPGGKKGAWLEFYQDSRLEDVLHWLKEFQYAVSMEFLGRCVPILEAAMLRQGKMTFFDCLYYLRNMLRRDAEGGGALIESIRARHSHFLIDEFQDTNPLQAEIFFYLTAEKPVPQWTRCVPRRGSLFIVGDPKQSIYRFRSADVTSFLQVRRLFEASGGAVLSLSRNFRSTRDLCACFNRVFSREFARETVNQSRFEAIPLPPAREDEFQGIFRYEAVVKPAEMKKRPEETDPARIEEIIRTLVEGENFRIRTEGDALPRRIRYGDIMVITRRKKDLGPIAARLAEADIPTRVEGQVPFAENEALGEVTRIYTAVADPGDGIALYSALTGRLLALTPGEIERYRQCGGRLSLLQSEDLPETAEEAARHVEQVLRRLQALRSEALRLTPAALFARILDSFRVFERVEAENLEVLCYAWELLRDGETAGELATLKDAGDLLTRLISQASEEERCLKLEDGQNCVHLANLHKVKGLEAPVVVLASAGTRASSASIRIQHGDTGAVGYLFELKGDFSPYFSTDAFAAEQAEENEALEAEKERLVYVAATRARNVLILCQSPEKTMWAPLLDEEPEPFPAAVSAPVQKTPAPAVEAAELYARAEAGSIFHNRSGEKATFQVENPSRLRLVSRVHGGREKPGEGEPDVPGYPALLGTLVHRMLEVLVTSRNRADPACAAEEIVREFRTPEFVSYEPRLVQALRSVAEQMRNGGYPQTNGLPQDMLGELLSAQEVFCEVPFCFREERDGQTVVWDGVMDVLYCAEGRWHIVDYKTSADGDGLDIRYQNQLQAYIRAFRAMTGLEADAGAYHIEI